MGDYNFHTNKRQAEGMEGVCPGKAPQALVQLVCQSDTSSGGGSLFKTLDLLCSLASVAFVAILTSTLPLPNLVFVPDSSLSFSLR